MQMQRQPSPAQHNKVIARPARRQCLPQLAGQTGQLGKGRVRSGHHYATQVGVGAALGAASGTLWHASEGRCLRAALALFGGMGQLTSALSMFLLFALGVATVASAERSKRAARALSSVRQ